MNSTEGHLAGHRLTQLSNVIFCQIFPNYYFNLAPATLGSILGHVFDASGIDGSSAVLLQQTLYPRLRTREVIWANPPILQIRKRRPPRGEVISLRSQFSFLAEFSFESRFLLKNQELFPPPSAACLKHFSHLPEEPSTVLCIRKGFRSQCIPVGVPSQTEFSLDFMGNSMGLCSLQ